VIDSHLKKSGLLVGCKDVRQDKSPTSRGLHSTKFYIRGVQGRLCPEVQPFAQTKTTCKINRKHLKMLFIGEGGRCATSLLRA